MKLIAQFFEEHVSVYRDGEDHVVVTKEGEEHRFTHGEGRDYYLTSFTQAMQFALEAAGLEEGYGG